jgi:hypothetical protein
MVLKFGTLRKVHQKNLESFEMWRWRRMQISWADRVRNEELFKRVKQKEKNVLQIIKRKKCDSIGHMLRRNCLLKRVIEG